MWLLGSFAAYMGIGLVAVYAAALLNRPYRRGLSRADLSIFWSEAFCWPLLVADFVLGFLVKIGRGVKGE